MQNVPERSGVTSDTGPFSIIPEWVLDADVSDRAVRLYALLGRYADSDTLEAWPSRKTLARRLRCSLDSVDRATKELAAIDAVTVESRYTAIGDNTSNLYTLHRVAASVRRPRRGSAASSSRVPAAQNENHLELEPGNEVPVETRPEESTFTADSATTAAKDEAAREAEETAARASASWELAREAWDREDLVIRRRDVAAREIRTALDAGATADEIRAAFDEMRGMAVTAGTIGVALRTVRRARTAARRDADEAPAPPWWEQTPVGRQW